MDNYSACIPQGESHYIQRLDDYILGKQCCCLQFSKPFTLNFYYQITKDQVDRYVPGRRVPSCQLYVKWTGQQEQPHVELVHRVDLLGAKEPCNFFLIRLPALPAPPQGLLYCHCIIVFLLWVMCSGIDYQASLCQILALSGLAQPVAITPGSGSTQKSEFCLATGFSATWNTLV